MYQIGRVVHHNVGVAVGVQAPCLGHFQQHRNVAQRENRRRDGAGDEFKVHVILPQLSAEFPNWLRDKFQSVCPARLHPQKIFPSS